jgi:signal transduction histidine kinase
MQSIGFRLTASFALLFSILIGFGIFGLLRLDDFNKESSAIRDRWLKSTRYIGDLNNYTSDFRAMEATFLLEPQSSDIMARSSETKTLDDAIMLSQRNYESVMHDDFESQLYMEFQQVWKNYRNEAERVFNLILTKNKADAIAIYLTSSSRTFSAASDLLDKLNDQNNLHAEQASHRATAAIQEAWNYISAAVALSGFTVLVILLYVTRTVAFPLKKLANCMQLLSHGDMDVSISGADRRNELGEMARAVAVFRSNAIELKVSQRGLASQATMLEEKLAHERRLNQQQRNFISMASHEFRTPMTIIDGHAQRLINSQELQSYEKTAERANKIRVAIKRMSVMIDNILRSSKFFDERPTLYMHKSEFDLRALLHEVCKLHREISANAIIIEDLGYNPLKICGDKDLLFQAFSNLVANSVKYSPGGGTIAVSAHIEENQVKICVKDEGIGIPEADIAHLFERYYRGSNVSSIVGTGIGLFLVKVVIDLHLGTINVTSQKGTGSVFEVRLPLKES